MGEGGISMRSIVTTVTAIGQWSAVKATQNGLVSGQRMIGKSVNADSGRLQCAIDGLVRKHYSLQLASQTAKISVANRSEGLVRALTHSHSCDYRAYGS